MSQVKPIRELAANGNLIHYRDSDGWECWREYDANGNRIHYWNSDGKEYWYWDGEITEDPIKILLLQKRLRDKSSPQIKKETPLQASSNET